MRHPGPLTRLCGPHAPWAWGTTEQRSFDKLKDCLATTPVLRVFDSDSGVFDSDTYTLDIPRHSYVVRNWRPVATFTGNVDTLPDAASYSQRTVALGPALS